MLSRLRNNLDNLPTLLSRTSRYPPKCRHAWVALTWPGQVETAVARCNESSFRSCGGVVSAASEVIVTADAHIDSLSRRQPYVDSDHRLRRPAALLAFDRPTVNPNDCAFRPSISDTGAVQEDPTSTGRPSSSLRSSRVQLGNPWHRGFAIAPLLSLPCSGAAPLGYRCYHAWFYGSKLRNQAVRSATSLDQLAAMMRHEGSRLDHINIAAFLRQLQRTAAQGVTRAATTPSSPTPGVSAPTPPPAPSVSAALDAAARRAVQQQVGELAAEAAFLAGKRAKWYDPRYAAAVVAATAVLKHTDGAVLQRLTDRVMDRLNEAYSHDLLLLLRGLHAHKQLSAAANTTTTSSSSLGGGGSGISSKRPRWQRHPPALPYSGPPESLLAGVGLFLAAKVPTGRMPPENLDGLLRYLRSLSGRPLGPALCDLATRDLTQRLSVYAPQPLAGLLTTLAAERRPPPLELLAAAADHFAATAPLYGTGHTAVRFLAAATAILRQQQQPQTQVEAVVGADGGDAAVREWLVGRPELLAGCLRLMARDLPGTSPDRLAQWLTVLLRTQLPLTALASNTTPTLATSGAVSSMSAAAPPASTSGASGWVGLGANSSTAPAADAAALFLRAVSGPEVERVMAAGVSLQTAARLKKAYDTVGLPYPKGLASV